LRWVRSPVAPKMVTVKGSRTRKAGSTGMEGGNVFGAAGLDMGGIYLDAGATSNGPAEANARGARR
jgi:hypothetical protein